MKENENQGKGRIIGMDIHPTVFSACALENMESCNNSFETVERLKKLV